MITGVPPVVGVDCNSVGSWLVGSWSFVVGSSLESALMKIDLFCHILPPAYFERMTAVSTRGAYMQKRVRGIPAMVDLDERFRMMDLFDDYVQVLSLAAPPIEALGSPSQTPELAMLA